MLVIIGTVAVYIWFTLKATEWRITIRREMNDSDTEANTKAIDSLLNFETVKYFGNEAMEANRFDDSMARYENAAIRTYYSLGILNAGASNHFHGRHDRLYGDGGLWRHGWCAHYRRFRSH